MSVLELWAYQSDNSTFLGVLEQAFGVKYLAELNGVGAGSFSFPADGAKAGYVAAGNVMRVRLDNADVGAFVVEQVEEDLLAEGGRVMRASGRGLLALFERGIVWPADVNAFYSAERTFLADTFASMIIDLAAEATARGVSLPTDDFSATLDSSGAAWTDSYTLAYRAGQTLLDVILHQAEIGPEVTISPAGVLHYWIQAGSDKSSTVLLREGQSVAKAGRTTSHRDLVNAVLGQGQYAFSVQTDATSISSYGRRERLANFGNVSDGSQLTALAQWARDEWKNPAVQIEMELVDDALTPFVSFDLGDTVGVRLVTAGVSASYRVRAIAIEQDGESHVRAAVTLNTLLNEYLLRVDRTLRRALMSPVESENHGNSDPNIGSWRISKTYLIYDTGTPSTSAGMAPADYPFYAGATYANRATAPFRVSSAGALTATNATITGTVTASAGAIGGWTIGASSLTGGNATLHSSGYLLLGTSNDVARLDAADATYRLWVGHATAGSAPFRVTKAGALTATSATITGTITSTSGTIGGWTLGASSLTGGDATLHSSGYLDLGTGNDVVRLDASNATYRLWIGNATASSAPFRVTKGGALTATSATITGTITSTSGTIGGWTLGATSLVAGSAGNTVGLDSGGTNPAIYAGSATPGSAPFRVTKTGALTATNATITGTVTATAGEIGGWTVGATSLVAGSAGNTVGLDSGGTNPAIYAGSATPGSAPFRVSSAGALTATNATITGTVTASAGTIGGWTLGASSLTGGDATLSSSGYLDLGTGNDVVRLDASNATYRLWIGNATAGSAPFRVTKAGALTATSATITGTITSTSGTIGGWTVGATSLVAGSAGNTVGLDSGGTNPAIYAGSATPGSAPFRVTAAGALVASNATITGTVTASAGAIGGWTVGASSLTGGNATLHSSGYLLLGTTNDIVRLDAADATYRLWIGNATAGSAPFRVTKAGALTATSVNITGTVSATAGDAGGWTINSTYLAKDTGTNATSAGMAPADYPFYAGATYANRATAPFRVTPAGALTATSATITGTVTASAGAIGGWTVGASSLTGGNATLHSSGYLLLGTTNDIVRLDAADATYRLWIGNATAGSAPFRVTKAGALTATSATITGTVTASAGAIGGWTVGASSLTGGNATLHSSGYLLLGTTNDIVRLDAADATYRLWIGNATAASAPFRVTKTGALTATNATITGTVTATAGAIGGWTLAATTLTGGDATLSSAGYLDLGTGNDIVRLDASNATYRLWIGNATASSAPFRITKAGYVTAISGSIGGFTLSGTSLYNGNFKLDAGNGRIYLDTASYIYWTGTHMGFNGVVNFLNDVALQAGLDMSGGAGNILMGSGSYIGCYSLNLYSGGTLGLFGTTPTTKKTVTGSRGGNAALASLLTQLAAYGLITDSSSA